VIKNVFAKVVFANTFFITKKYFQLIIDLLTLTYSLKPMHQ